jgi:uncharacterized OB-fold protein
MNLATQEPAVPLVDYLELGDPPTLHANRCQACGARFFDRRNACAACGKTDFERVALARRGAVRSFTVVHRATPDVRVPYVSVVVELDDGKFVKANLVGVEPDAALVVPGLRVELTTWAIGRDPEGAEAVTFGFRPLPDGDLEDSVA